MVVLGLFGFVFWGFLFICLVLCGAVFVLFRFGFFTVW